MKTNNSQTYTLIQLAEERTVLAFIRTVAIFAGIYAILRKTIKNKFIPKLVVLLMNIILLYRISYLRYTAHRHYLQIFGILLIISMTLLVFASKG